MARRHQTCANCGKYRGRQVIDIVARAERTADRTKRKSKEMRESGQAEKPEKKEDEKKS